MSPWWNEREIKTAKKEEGEGKGERCDSKSEFKRRKQRWWGQWENEFKRRRKCKMTRKWKKREEREFPYMQGVKQLASITFIRGQSVRVWVGVWVGVWQCEWGYEEVKVYNIKRTNHFHPLYTISQRSHPQVIICTSTVNKWISN